MKKQTKIQVTKATITKCKSIFRYWHRHRNTSVDVVLYSGVARICDSKIHIVGRPISIIISTGTALPSGYLDTSSFTFVKDESSDWWKPVLEDLIKESVDMDADKDYEYIKDLVEYIKNKGIKVLNIKVKRSELYGIYVITGATKKERITFIAAGEPCLE
jgi:hypothetical protein